MAKKKPKGLPLRMDKDKPCTSCGVIGEVPVNVNLCLDCIVDKFVTQIIKEPDEQLEITPESVKQVVLAVKSLLVRHFKEINEAYSKNRPKLTIGCTIMLEAEENGGIDISTRIRLVKEKLASAVTLHQGPVDQGELFEGES